MGVEVLIGLGVDGVEEGVDLGFFLTDCFTTLPSSPLAKENRSFDEPIIGGNGAAKSSGSSKFSGGGGGVLGVL